MAGQGKGSRWGSFLSQAVAGMEAHLDNMLAEGDGTPSGSRPPGSSGATTPSRQATPNNSNVQTQPGEQHATQPGRPLHLSCLPRVKHPRALLQLAPVLAIGFKNDWPKP